tara:strand:- start:37 stop:1182 length:1146 start_codon:yes stop_codon:yes gene_type:complete
MNILTDILSLIQRGKFATVAGKDDVVVLGMWNEKPEMTGVASPIPYKSVKLIKIKDLASSENCDYINVPADPLRGSVGVFQKEEIDPTTQKCTVSFRSLKSMSTNLTLALSADDDYIEITTQGEPNLAANVGTGAKVWKDKVGETLNFKSLVQGAGITIGESTNEITITANAQPNTTYTYSSSQSAANVDLKLNGSDGSLGNVKLVAGTNITLADSGSNEVTINSTGGGGGMTNFLVGGDSGSNQTVSDGDTVDIEGGDGISTVGTGGPKVVVNMDHYYQGYVCKLTQTGINPPTEVIVYNDTGLTLTWQRVAVGRYQATWSTPVDSTKVTVNPMPIFKNNPNILNVIAFANTGFQLCTNTTSAATDDVLQDTPIEIRIYP